MHKLNCIALACLVMCAEVAHAQSVPATAQEVKPATGSVLKPRPASGAADSVAFRKAKDGVLTSDYRELVFGKIKKKNKEVEVDDWQERNSFVPKAVTQAGQNWTGEESQSEKAPASQE
jgi:hypothetical protein